MRYIYTDRFGTEHNYNVREIRDAMEVDGLRYNELQGHMEDIDRGETLTADNGATFRKVRHTYTVTLVAAQGGRIPHVYQIDADTPQEAIVAAYRERHGDHVNSTTRDVHPRGMDITDTAWTIYGTAGAVTFADVVRHH